MTSEQSKIIFLEVTNTGIRLEPVTWENIDDVIAHSQSGDGFFPLPHGDDAADRYINLASNQRRHGKGDIFNAYTDDTFVGGGQIYDTSEVIKFGYWVAWNKRRQGFGKAILATLECEACSILPARNNFELEIDKRNQPSQALAAAMGYAALLTGENGMMIYRKQRDI